jgi:hypothetical protein
MHQEPPESRAWNFWRIGPVFFTSTFQDMQAERDSLLWNFVFPAIEDQLRCRRHLEWIDLRLGTGERHAETARPPHDRACGQEDVGAGATGFLACCRSAE